MMNLIYFICSNIKLNRNSKCFTGNVVRPDRASATFVSFIGNLDKRVELDSSIKYGDGKYNAALAMMASKASYENQAYVEAIVKDNWKVQNDYIFYLLLSYSY
jgi:hypothetical protein